MVTDDGAGFDPEAVQRRRPGVPLQRFGLYGMRERAQMLERDLRGHERPGRGAPRSGSSSPAGRALAPEMPVDDG